MARSREVQRFRYSTASGTLTSWLVAFSGLAIDHIWAVPNIAALVAGAAVVGREVEDAELVSRRGMTSAISAASQLPMWIIAALPWKKRAWAVVKSAPS